MTTKTDEQERADFEAWHKSEYPGVEVRVQNLIGTYTKTTVDKAWHAYQAGRAALQSQDREDALRYRWLRHCTDDQLENMTNELGVLPDGQELDEAIDHARRIEGEGE